MNEKCDVETLRSELEQMKAELKALKALNKQYERELSLVGANRGEDSETSISGENTSESNTGNSSSLFRLGISEVSQIIPNFDPSKKSGLTAQDWIGNIESLMTVYGWDGRVTLLYAIYRLEGAARYWYESRQPNINSWENFKVEFIKAFPTEKDESSIMFEIMTRKRRRDECVENYFYNVASLAKRINLKEETTIRYIISGLGDSNLVNILLAANCTNLNELLVHIKRFEQITEQEKQRQILNRCENREEPKASGSGWRNTKKDRHRPYENMMMREGKWKNKDTSSKTQQANDSKKGTYKGGKCFKCGEIGHFAINCKASFLPSSNYRTCYICRKNGHIAKECTDKKISAIEEEKQNSIRNKDEYHPVVRVNQREVVAYLDLGSECSTIWQSLVTENGWKIEKYESNLIGFGGNKCLSLGKIRANLRVSAVELEIDMLVVPDRAQTTPVIVGRNFLDRPDIKVTKTWGVFGIEKIKIDNDTTKQNSPRKVPFEMKDLMIPASVEERHQNALLKLVNDYRDCFGNCIQDTGKTNILQLKITLKENKIIRYHPYKVAYGLKEEIRKKVQELLDADIIQESTSEYASPVLMIPKKNGELRMCVDFRKINSITKREYYPVPNIEDTLNSLSNKKYFTTVDLMNGYYQIPVDPECRHLTAFVTPEGHYEFKRMPFGLTNAPAVFMRLMKEISKRLNSEHIVCYMDDVLIATETIEKNLETLHNLLKEMRKANLTINLKKCEFLKTKINFLGHEISIEGIKPGEIKTSAITEYKRPETIKEVRQFLGLAGYFRRFVKEFSKIATPLNSLLKKDAEFEWTSKQEDAFKQLKEILSQRPVLVLYDQNAEHELHTDASSAGLAGILMQKDKDGKLRAVSYFSRATNDAEKKYHSYELEALAVVESMERFKHYLLHKHFTVVTDCNSLKLTQEKKDLVPRIARWWLKIAEYDFELVYRPGTQMNHADALSRHPHESAKEIEPVNNKILIVGMKEEEVVDATISRPKPYTNSENSEGNSGQRRG